jgi:hypothetical protein
MALSRAGLHEAVVNLHFVASALQGLAVCGVPLYYVRGPRVCRELPQHRAQGGLYCVASLRQQHRLAVALFQRDYATCAVADLA